VNVKVKVKVNDNDNDNDNAEHAIVVQPMSSAPQEKHEDH
jgi:hypothetical protein